MTAACIEAYYATGEQQWLDRARWVFEWFLGRNDLGVFLYDSRTGGCRDGLQADGANENQGAEATLAFLLALAEMRQLQSTLATQRQGQSAGPALVGDAERVWVTAYVTARNDRP